MFLIILTTSNSLSNLFWPIVYSFHNLLLVLFLKKHQQMLIQYNQNFYFVVNFITRFREIYSFNLLLNPYQPSVSVFIFYKPLDLSSSELSLTKSQSSLVRPKYNFCSAFKMKLNSAQELIKNPPRTMSTYKMPPKSPKRSRRV